MLFISILLWSVFGLNHEPFFHVQLLDKFLKEIFQTEHIRYKGTDGYHECDFYEYDLASVLLERIANAIERKLDERPAIIRKFF